MLIQAGDGCSYDVAFCCARRAMTSGRITRMNAYQHKGKSMKLKTKVVMKMTVLDVAKVRAR